MIAEPILAFFLIRYLRKILRTSPALSQWDKPLRYAMIGVALLFVIQSVFSMGAVTIWIWHVLLLLIIGITFKHNEFYTGRNVMFAVLPLVIGFILENIAKLLPDELRSPIQSYLPFAFPFAVIWMVAMLVISGKQQKAL